ncbi:hypothetical protein [Chelatococcus sambhunathii]|uniref:hypothetical protein n=1 Tax=Chelatococcus sambhunathii TaxID=363953 RepID=UPI002852A0C0|nr:hypothetical protein [Chelatococcus sambhunathii]
MERLDDSQEHDGRAGGRGEFESLENSLLAERASIGWDQDALVGGLRPLDLDIYDSDCGWRHLTLLWLTGFGAKVEEGRGAGIDQDQLRHTRGTRTRQSKPRSSSMADLDVALFGGDQKLHRFPRGLRHQPAALRPRFAEATFAAAARCCARRIFLAGAERAAASFGTIQRVEDHERSISPSATKTS